MQLESQLLKKYSGHGPRYTSYPTAVHFTPQFGVADYRRHVDAGNGKRLPNGQFAASNDLLPLSLYLHIPFCHSLCYYCGCNKIVTPKQEKATEYLEYLYREIAMHGALYNPQRQVLQIHFGGGTPNFLSPQQLAATLDVLAREFNFASFDKMEVSIEIDPRTVDKKAVQQLVEIGFNRISIGVQDFDKKVQQAINRLQSDAEIEAVFAGARASGVEAISVDLIYGLPGQNTASFNRTLNKIIELRPMRIALYHYAHMPDNLSSQKLIDERLLPNSAQKLELFNLSLKKLAAAGYEYIGMDHFALPEDSLAQALQNKDLHRNFQGYSIHSDCDMIGMGLSSISKVNRCYSQNQRNLTAYMRSIDAGEIPILHGVELGEDDVIRAYVIQQIMCSAELKYTELSARFAIDFTSYFARELAALEKMVADNLVDWLKDEQNVVLGFKVSKLGRLFLRNIAMLFDAYLEQKTHTSRGRPIFSKTI